MTRFSYAKAVNQSAVRGLTELRGRETNADSQGQAGLSESGPACAASATV